MEAIVTKKIAKPSLRGRFHEAAAFLSLGACLMLIDHASEPRMKLAVAVYSFSLISLFSISALYHRVHWSDKARNLMRRLDHAAIFGLIAGTTTPVFLLTLPSPQNIQAIGFIWFVALAGICQVIFWIHAPKRLAALLYVAAGWFGVSYLSQMLSVLGKSGLNLLLAGGIIYTLGAVVYALKKPNPAPNHLGYHEIFHISTIIAAVCHFLLIKQLLQP